MTRKRLDPCSVSLHHHHQCAEILRCFQSTLIFQSQVNIVKLSIEREKVKNRYNKQVAQYREFRDALNRKIKEFRGVSREYDKLYRSLKAELPDNPSQEDWEFVNEVLSETETKMVTLEQELLSNELHSLMVEAYAKFQKTAWELAEVNQQVAKLNNMLSAEK